MIEIITAIILGTCPATILINKSDYDWNSHDNRIQRSSARSCKREYGKDTCLKTFIKKGQRNYYAICGEPND